MPREPDPERPNCPYFPGFTCEIEPHTPPEPFGGRDYPPIPRSFADQSIEERRSLMQMILDYPPLETERRPSETDICERATLLITQSFMIGNARGPQLVLCTISPSEGSPNASPFTCMAKVFDGLYYSKISGDYCLVADRDYSREAAAYEHLTKAKMTGGFAPEYYGSWTAKLPVPPEYNDSKRTEGFRPVRLILMEAIQGVSMRSMFSGGLEGHADCFLYPEDYRLEVMAQILDGETRQFHAGVDQHDLYPRNIVIAPDPLKVAGATAAGSVPRVVLVDYNQARVSHKTKYGLNTSQKRPLPRNPKERWHDDHFLGFVGWVPTCWHDREDEGSDSPRLAWLEKTFGGEREALYEPAHPEDWD